MAEYVRARFQAARVGVTMAILGLLAGLGIKTEASQPTTTVVADPAAASLLKKNAITSIQIKNGSLLFKDLKIHQVPSYKQYKLFTTQLNEKWIKLDTTFLKLDDAAKSFLKIDDANLKFLKIDDANARFLKLDDANANFLHKADTAADSLKLGGLTKDQLVQGHGQVVTGTAALGASDSDVFILIGLLKATAKTSVGGANTDVTLTNLSPNTLTLNGDGKTVEIAPGGTSTVTFGDGSVHTLQAVDGAGKQAITIGLSSFLGGNTHTVVGQAMVSSY